jgi:hypothetical protein
MLNMDLNKSHNEFSTINFINNKANEDLHINEE